MKLNLGIIFGGRSVEHEISVVTAMQVIAAVDRSRYRVVPIYIAKDGTWYHGPGMEQVESFYQLPTLLAQARKVVIAMLGNHCRLVMQKNYFWQRSREIDLDVVLPIMHGSCGEDGSLQGMLELWGVPYVGSGVLSSAIGMDKVATKWAMRSLGVNVVEDYWFYSDRWLSERALVLQELKAKGFGYPLIVKPADLGSSVGVREVADDDELVEAIDLVVRLSNKVLVEPKVQNMREINCAALGDHESVITSVCEEPIFTGAVLSYADKYQSGERDKSGKLKINKVGCKTVGPNTGGMSSAQREIPAKISSELAREIKMVTQKIFRGLDCSGVVRMDYLWDEKQYRLYLCEINTIPGSLAFYLWDYEGIDFTELLERLIELALKRYRQRGNLIRTYAGNILSGTITAE